MKKIAGLLMIALFVCGMTVSAQEQTPSPVRKGQMKEMRKGAHTMLTAEKRAEHITKELGLTDAEKAKVQALFEKQDAKMKAHKAEMEKIREEQKAKFEAERKAQDAELEKIIGNEKFQKHEALRAERAEKQKQRREMAPNDSTSARKRGPRPGVNAN